MKWTRYANGLLGAVLAIVTSVASGVSAATIQWTDWTTANSTTATGTMAGITVNFSGNLTPSAQTAGGVNYWAASSSTYTSPPTAENPPPDADIIRLTGGPNAGTQTLTFSQPVDRPFLAIMSLGQGGVPVIYDFDTPFDILTNGPGHWGNGPLTELAGDMLEGREGHGLIRFKGKVSSISWTIPTAENWHGFQVGIPASIPEPSTLALTALAGVVLFGTARWRPRG